jgi:hypothetical protein
LMVKVEVPGDRGGDGKVEVDSRESVNNVATITCGVVYVEDAKNIVAICEIDNKAVCMIENVGSGGSRDSRNASSHVDRDAGMTGC